IQVKDGTWRTLGGSSVGTRFDNIMACPQEIDDSALHPVKQDGNWHIFCSTLLAVCSISSSCLLCTLCHHINVLCNLVWSLIACIRTSLSWEHIGCKERIRSGISPCVVYSTWKRSDCVRVCKWNFACKEKQRSYLERKNIFHIRNGSESH